MQGRACALSLRRPMSLFALRIKLPIKLDSLYVNLSGDIGWPVSVVRGYISRCQSLMTSTRPRWRVGAHERASWVVDDITAFICAYGSVVGPPGSQASVTLDASSHDVMDTQVV